MPPRESGTRVPDVFSSVIRRSFSPRKRSIFSSSLWIARVSPPVRRTKRSRASGSKRNFRSPPNERTRSVAASSQPLRLAVELVEHLQLGPFRERFVKGPPLVHLRRAEEKFHLPGPEVALQRGAQFDERLLYRRRAAQFAVAQENSRFSARPICRRRRRAGFAEPRSQNEFAPPPGRRDRRNRRSSRDRSRRASVGVSFAANSAAAVFTALSSEPTTA